MMMFVYVVFETLVCHITNCFLIFFHGPPPPLSPPFPPSTVRRAAYGSPFTLPILKQVSQGQREEFLFIRGRINNYSYPCDDKRQFSPIFAIFA